MRSGYWHKHLVRDGMHQVRLTEASLAVNEERIVSTAGRIGHCHARRVRELVACSDDEIIEGIARIEERAARLRHLDSIRDGSPPSALRERS